MNKENTLAMEIIFTITVANKKQWLLKSTPKGYFYKPKGQGYWERLTEDRFHCGAEQATAMTISYGTHSITYQLKDISKDKSTK